MLCAMAGFFFFSSRRRHTRLQGDWSSDVCSSDLMAEVCPTCSGSGAAPGATLSTCPECRGRGVISFGQGGFAVSRPCPVCRGRGRVPSERCHTCGGSGEVRVEKRLVITVPAGTEDGTKLRLRGQGTKGKGDVVVVLQVEADHFFRAA